MEDILASIRRIISDDDEGGEGGEDGTEADVPEPGAELGQDAVDEIDFDSVAPVEEPAAEDETNDQGSIDDIFELTEVIEDEAEPEPDEELGQDAVDAMDFDAIGADDDEDAADLDFVDAEAQAADEEPEAEPDPAPEPEPEIDFAAAPVEPAPDGEESPSLLSSGAQATASAAFGALASTMLSHSGGARTLEEIVEDLLRPLLKGWLDQNLPPLVEKLVREEIERVARRGQ